jgi:hypothetical protein
VEQRLEDTGLNQEHFFNILKKAYDKGINEKEITVKKILDELKLDLKNSTLK